MECNDRTTWFRRRTPSTESLRALRWRVKRDVDHGSELDVVVLLKSERCEDLVSRRGVRPTTGNELHKWLTPGKNGPAEVLGIDQVTAGASGLAAQRARYLGSGGNFWQFPELRHRL